MFICTGEQSGWDMDGVNEDHMEIVPMAKVRQVWGKVYVTCGKKIKNSRWVSNKILS